MKKSTPRLLAAPEAGAIQYPMLVLGPLSLRSRVVLAPMAGVTDLPCRMVARSMGAELAFVEMTSVNALVHQNRKTLKLLETREGDRPLGVQLVGAEPETLREALAVLRPWRFDVLDLNAACPVKKVTKKGEGAALMCEPRRLAALVRVMVEHGAGAAVTVKLRAGWDAQERNAPEAARAAEEAGAHAVFVHGRTRAQGYRGQVDYGIIREVKAAVGIPVLGSGDVLSAPLALAMLRETGCDGLAVARGGLGNPWLFREIEALLEGKELPPRPDRQEVAEVMARHLRMCVGFYGPSAGVRVFRKFFVWYTKGLSGVKPLRVRALQATDMETLLALIDRATARHD
jgi:tRNA-dihydrouridine synthase B